MSSLREGNSEVENYSQCFALKKMIYFWLCLVSVAVLGLLIATASPVEHGL